MAIRVLSLCLMWLVLSFPSKVRGDDFVCTTNILTHHAMSAKSLLPFSDITDDTIIYDGHLDDVTLVMTTWLAYSFLRYNLQSLFVISSTTNGFSLRKGKHVNRLSSVKRQEKTKVIRSYFSTKENVIGDDLYVLYKFYSEDLDQCGKKVFLVALYVNVNKGEVSLSVCSHPTVVILNSNTQSHISHVHKGYYLLDYDEAIIQSEIAEQLFHQKVNQLNQRLNQYSEKAKQLLNHRSYGE